VGEYTSSLATSLLCFPDS